MNVIIEALQTEARKQGYRTINHTKLGKLEFKIAKNGILHSRINTFAVFRNEELYLCGNHNIKLSSNGQNISINDPEMLSKLNAHYKSYKEQLLKLF